MVLQRLKNWVSKVSNFFKLKSYSWLAIACCFIFLALPIFTMGESNFAVSNTTSFNIPQNGNLTEMCNQSINSFGVMIPLYSKLKTTDILGNDSRESILNLIQAKPGITFGAITRQLNLKTGTVSHHLRILEREGYIKSKKTGKFRRYYILGTKATGFNEIQDKIVETVQDHPGISQSTIGRELQLSRQLVNYHLKELVLSNVIVAEKIGNKCVCFYNHNVYGYNT